jgi:hypothetical protein
VGVLGGEEPLVNAARSSGISRSQYFLNGSTCRSMSIYARRNARK